MQKKIVLGLLLTTMMLATALFSMPVTALDYDSAETGERQIVAYGMLHDELFPEYNNTRWQRRSINVGFTAYGEMVTDQDPFGTGSDRGVGLTYPTDSAWQVDMAAGTDGTDYGIYPCEHIATPAKSGADWHYFPIEGWQLYWHFHAGTPSYAVDPNWHISMAIYGNHSTPYGRARVDVVPESVTVITNTSRLMVVEVKVLTNNETLHTAFGFEPQLFEITAEYVFFKNTKKVASYWTIEYLKTEYGPVDVVFRRMTDFDIDQKFQEGEDEAFAVFYPNSKRNSWQITGVTTPDQTPGNHMFWTGCEYWPQNYSLAVVWTNSSIEHWVPPDGYSVAPQHHAAVVAYYPNCSNWDTDNWNHYVYNLHRPGPPTWLFFGEGLGRRFGTQPVSVEYRSIDDAHYTAADLLLGQWNVTLSSATAFKKAKFLTVFAITNCSDTFGYDNNPSSYDWDSDLDLSGQVTVGELKYLLSEFFNATYKLSTETGDAHGTPLDMSNWYPFSGVEYHDWYARDGNVWINRLITGCDPRNTTFIIGDSAVHYDTVTNQGAATIDVVGAVMAGEAFGAYTTFDCVPCDTDPMWLAMYDTQVFSPLATAPHYTLTKNSLVYPDPVPVTLGLTAWQRRVNRWCNLAGQVTEIFTTPTCYTWDVNHTICVGGPRVNLGTEYFNEHTWIIWVDPDATGSELPEAGFYSIPTGTFYPASDECGYSLINICDDLNLTSWNTVYDYATDDCVTFYQTNATALDGPTLVDPYAGLLVYGVSGIDTHAASYFLAHYWCNFHDLYTNATFPKRGAVCILLNTEKMCGVVDNDWNWAIQEIVGPPAGRWRAETGVNWGPWMSYPCSIDWFSETGT